MSADSHQKKLADILKSQIDVFLEKPFAIRLLLLHLAKLLPRKEGAS